MRSDPILEHLEDFVIPFFGPFSLVPFTPYFLFLFFNPALALSWSLPPPLMRRLSIDSVSSASS